MNTESTQISSIRAIIIGLAVSVLTAIFMIIMMKAGIAPFPKPPSLAFAQTLIGHPLPLPVGLLFHTAYVTFWSVLYLKFFGNNSLAKALGLAGVLWIVILTVFFPIIGWGIAGTGISPKLIPASFVPHLLFGLLLWGIAKKWGK